MGCPESRKIPVMGNFFCVVCELDDFVDDDDRAFQRQHNQRKKQLKDQQEALSFRNGKKIASLAPSIIEDPLLEDMCAMGELEFDGDAENMTKRDKGGTYLKLQTHLLEQRQKKQYY